MQLNKIIEDYVVSEQVTPDDIKHIKEAGFKTIFWNRPDNEENNQVTVASIKKIAEEALAEAKVRQKNKKNIKKTKEINGPDGPEPTRYGDWEKKGIVYDF